MIIYIASDGQARLVSPQHVYQGSSVTDITVIAPFPAQTAMTVAFSLPDGKMFGGVQGTMQTPPYLMTPLANQPELPDGVQAWQYVMPFAITQNAGQAKVSVTAQFAQGSGEATSFTQQTSAQVEFTIEPSTVGTLPDEPTEDAWKQVAAAIGELGGEILAAQNDISDIENGDTTVGKAKADQKGNVIDETYATQTALAETNEALAVEQENVDDLQSRMTAVEGSIEEIRDNASDALEYSEQALDNSETAVQTANQAKTVADGIDAKATTALETSNAASTNAAQALQKANAATEAANAAQAAVASKQDATDNNLDTTDKTVVGAINENKTAIDGLRQDILNEAHFRGYFATNAEIQATTANLNDFAYSAQSGTVWIYGASGWADSGEPVPDKTTPLSDATPVQDGTAAAGASTSAARGDHVHPTDTTRAAKSTVDNIISGAQVVGAATKATQDANGNVIDETYATKDELLETTGTEVKVNGTTQTEVNFTSDPQTQITANKNAIAEAQSDIGDIVSGAQPVGKATTADSATNATNAANATKATQDAGGNVINTTYAKLSQVVRTDTVSSNTDEQKRVANENTLRYVTGSPVSAGWYRVAQLSGAGVYEINISSSYLANPCTAIKFIVAVSTATGYNVSITQIGGAPNLTVVTQARLNEDSGNLYFEIYVANPNNPIGVSYKTVTSLGSGLLVSNITPVAFTNIVSDTNVIAAIKVVCGINTTGGVHQQGAPVFATDPSKLAPSTANGWTQTTATGSLPSSGVYMVVPNASVGTLGIGVMFYAADRISASAIGAPSGAISLYYTPSGDTKWYLYDANGTLIQLTDIRYKRIA